MPFFVEHHVSARTVVIIPARYASTRFPAKPLARQTGKYLIQHVYEQVECAPLINDLWVATDDERIAEAVRGFGGKVKMTRTDHASGTDRLAEAASDIDCDIVINVQGDEPEIEPFSISQLAELIEGHPDCSMATLACPFRYLPHADPKDPHAVKAYVNSKGIALNFSRKWTPTDDHPWTCEPGDPIQQDPHPLLHLGIYAYRKDFLLTFPTLPPTPREQEERLEQLRALDNGHRILVGLVRKAGVGIDTPDDYAAFVSRWNAKHKTPTN